MNVGDRITITAVAVPETGAKDEHNVCAECVFNAVNSCREIECDELIYVPEEAADEYIVRAMERRME